MKTTQITTFLTHLRPHLDEIASRWMLRNWGELFFPGISVAQMKYLTTGVLPDNVPPQVLLEMGVLPVGVGGGPLDEHPSEFGDRKHDECATTLTMKAIKKQDDAALIRLATEILHCDLTNLVRPTQLSTLIKLRHRRNPINPERVIEWANQALDALYGAGAVFVPNKGENDLMTEVWEGLLKERGWNDPKILKHMDLLFRQTKGRENYRLTDLAHVFRVIRKTDVEKAVTWLSDVLVEMYLDSAEFFKAVDELNIHGKVIEFHSERLTFPVIAIQSDTEHLSLAARSKYCGYNALVIQRNSRGNNAVFLNVHNEHVAQERLTLDNLVRMIRLREQTRLGYPQGLWPLMAAEGTLRRLRMWYYSMNGDAILNGSLTTPDVKPSKLALEEILEISRSAFRRKSIDEWRSKYAFLGDKQLRKGTFRHRPTPLQGDAGLLRAGVGHNHLTEHLPSQEEVRAELERIMVAG